jgi:type VI secretion system secreted protein Hcp
MNKLTALMILVLSFATAAAAQGPPGLEKEKKNQHEESAITIKIAGLNCSTDLGSNTFSATAYAFGADNSSSGSSGGGGGTGKATVLPLNATKNFDACSPALFEGVVSGRHFQTADLVQKDEKGNPILTINLSDVLITSYRIGGSEASDTPHESIQIDFRKICISETGNGNKLCFDRATNTTS